MTDSPSIGRKIPWFSSRRIFVLLGLGFAFLVLELAKLDRLMYIDENSGTFKLATEEIERQIR
jgi:hypothetical protein